VIGLVALVLLALAAVVTLTVLRHNGVPLPGGSPVAASAAPTSRPTEARTNGQPTAAELEGFVRGYYALLPGEPEQAWAMLGDAARAASNGYQSYVNFYNGLDSVGFAEGPTAVDGRTVRATLRFQPKSGNETTERYQFTVVPGPDGKLVMSSFSRG